MSHVLWASIAASAVVAAVITLVIEYLAKPWLEARKERILEEIRRRRTLVRGLGHAAWLSEAIVAMQPAQERRQFRDRTIRHAAEAQPLVLAGVQELDVPDALFDEWQLSTVRLVNFTERVQLEMPPEEMWENLKVAAAKVARCAELFAMSRWHWRRRRRLIREIRDITWPPALGEPATGETRAANAD